VNLPDPGFPAVLAWILEFREALRVPASLRELGVREDNAKAIAAAAVTDPTAGSNPRPLSESEFEQLTLSAIRGHLGS
jgi:alcohol dehydrogenase class IV